MSQSKKKSSQSGRNTPINVVDDGLERKEDSTTHGHGTRRSTVLNDSVGGTDDGSGSSITVTQEQLREMVQEQVRNAMYGMNPILPQQSVAHRAVVVSPSSVSTSVIQQGERYGVKSLPYLVQGDNHYIPWKKTVESILRAEKLYAAISGPSGHVARSVIGVVNDRTSRNGLRGIEDDDASSRGDIVTPGSDADEATRCRVYVLLLVAINRNTEAMQVISDVPYGNSYEAWSRLEQHYQGLSEMNKPYLLNQFLAIKMTNGEKIGDYTNRLKKITMDLSTVGMTMEVTMVVHQLLKGLDSRFDAANQYLVARNASTNMNYDEVVTYLRNQEIQMKGDKPRTVTKQAAANYVSAASSTCSGSVDTNKIQCFNCQQYGHYADKCTNERVPRSGNNGYRGKPNSKGKPKNGAVTCTYCAKSGHVVADCHTKQRADALKHGGKNNSGDGSGTNKPAAALGVTTNTGIIKGSNIVSVVKSVESVSTESSGVDFHLDTGAAAHNAPGDTPLENAVVNSNIKLRVANGELLSAPSEGDLMIHTPCADRPLHLRSVLTHDNMKSHLMSVSQICQSPIVKGVWFDANGAQVITVDGEILINAHQADGVYVVKNCHYSNTQTAVSESVRTERDNDKVSLWHSRLTHLGVTGMARTVHHKVVIGLDDIANLRYDSSTPAASLMDLCSGCAQGKSHRAPLGKGTPPDWVKAELPMDRWHADSFGPFPTSIGGNRYCLLIIDEASDKTFCYTISKKSDEADAIQDCYRKAKVYHGKPLKEFHTDGGGEFRSNELLDFWSTEGVKVTTSLPHTPQQNGRAERKGRSIVEGIRTVLHHAKAPVELWAEAAKAIVYVLNMVAVQKTASHTANQRWCNRSADGIQMVEDVKHLRVLFCDAWVMVPQADRTKLESKARLCIFIGYDETALGYRFLDVQSSTYTIVKSRDARFDETKFTQCKLLREQLASGADGNSSSVDEQSYDDYLNNSFDAANLRLGMILSAAEQQPPSNESNLKEGKEEKKSVSFNGVDSYSFVDDYSGYDSDGDDSVYVPNSGGAAASGTSSGELRRSTRQSVRPHSYGMVDLEDVAADMVTVTGDKPTSVHPPDPTNLKELLLSPFRKEFEEAIEAEHRSIVEKGVMVEVLDPNLLIGVKPLPTKHVFKTKLVDGEIDRRKARLVVLGNMSIPGLHFNEDELSAPTPAATSLRMVFAITAQLDYDLRQIDIKTAFLNAPLKEDVYITLPKGAANARGADGKIRVFKLLKALYGLKQAPKEWNTEFDGTIRTECGFNRLQSDTCIYILTTKSGRPLLLCVFVDDAVFAYHPDDASEMEEIINKIKKKYDVSDGGECKFLLGMRVSRNSDRSLTIDLQSYLERVLEKAGMSDCIPVATPECVGIKLTTFGSTSSNDSSKLHEKCVVTLDTDELDEKFKIRYRQHVGELLYAYVWIRLDYGHAIVQLTRFMSNPKQSHWNALIRLLRYIKSCTSLGLTFRKSKEVLASDIPILLGPVYADSNYAGDPEFRKSTTGIIIKLNNNVIDWQSKRQASVSDSSTHAEYIALHEAAKKVMWIRQMLNQMGFTQAKPTMIYGDNMASLLYAKNEVNHGRMKHIDVKHHFIQEQILVHKTIDVSHISTTLQQADMLTKALSKHLFNDFRTKVMEVNNKKM